MRLMTLDEKTKLPVPTAEALTIDCFNRLWKRVKRIDGDADGRKKIMNTKEFGYIYFSTVFDSRFKLKDDREREIAIRRLLGLSDDWIPDELVKECIPVFADTQVTASYELVSSLEGAASATSKWITIKKASIATGAMEPDDVKKILDIIDRAPTTVETLTKAKAVLLKEQDALATGKKGRTLNKFEMPEK